MTRTGELTQMLLSHYHTTEDATTNKHIAITQVRSEGTHAEATADAIIIGNWPSSGYEIEGCEVKVSRSDWLNELKHPGKSEYIKRYCDRWWLVISDDSFVKEGELPEDWGLKSIRGAGLRTIIPAPKLQRAEPTVAFISSLMRANKRESIPIDVHNDKVKDAKRDIEVEIKSKYEALLSYVSFLNKGLGIELKWDRSWEYGEYVNRWVAKIKSDGHAPNPESTLKLLKAAIGGTTEKLGWELYQARAAAKTILDLTDSALDESSSDWAKRRK